MKISLVQYDIAWGDPRTNLLKASAALDRAGEAGLYVLPEMFTTGFATLPGAVVEKEPSAVLDWMRGEACGRRAAIAGSVALELPDGKCVNRMYFVTPEGVAGSYDKRHLFGYGGEGERFTGGRQRVIVDYHGVRFLLAICYDLRFPVWLRSRGDYDAIIVSANWPQNRRFAWDTLARARAIENQCYVLAVNRTGEDPACSYDGGTALIGPYGETLAAVEDGREDSRSGELDMERLVSFRAKFPVLEGADEFKIMI